VERNFRGSVEIYKVRPSSNLIPFVTLTLGQKISRDALVEPATASCLYGAMKLGTLRQPKIRRGAPAPVTAREDYQAMGFSVTKSALLNELTTTQGVVERKLPFPSSPIFLFKLNRTITRLMDAVQ
jgi:hypothetical protein